MSGRHQQLLMMNESLKELSHFKISTNNSVLRGKKALLNPCC